LLFGLLTTAEDFTGEDWSMMKKPDRDKPEDIKNPQVQFLGTETSKRCFWLLQQLLLQTSESFLNSS
jgi:hypothetical protein